MVVNADVAHGEIIRQRWLLPGSSNGLQSQSPLTDLVVAQVQRWLAWLADNNVEGFLGEVGWPHDGPSYVGVDHGSESADWNALGERVLVMCRDAGVPVTYWHAHEGGETNHPITAYDKTVFGGALVYSRSQSSVLERYFGPFPATGINVAGAEDDYFDAFGADNIGNEGKHYWYPTASSLAYLATRGVKFIRLPIRWERLTTTPGSELRPSELARLDDTLMSAGNAGLGVILDLHNYSRYVPTASQTWILHRDTGNLTQAHLVDFWNRISDQYKNNPTVTGYGLMNEPHDMAALGAGPADIPARHWEEISQAVVTSLRNTKADSKLILVSGYNWSGLGSFGSEHPRAWIHDDADNTRYEAHLYFDSAAPSRYEDTYADENAYIQGFDRRVIVRDGPLNVRDSPGLGGGILASMPTGTMAEVVRGEHPQEVDDFTWRNVSFLAAGITGWVAFEYVEFR